jgi:hypothetical protein
MPLAALADLTVPWLPPLLLPLVPLPCVTAARVRTLAPALFWGAWPRASGPFRPMSSTASTRVKSRKLLRISPTCRLAPALPNSRSSDSCVILRPNFLALPSTSRSKCVADADRTFLARSPKGRPPSGLSLSCSPAAAAAAATGSASGSWAAAARLAALLLRDCCCCCRRLLLLVGSSMVCWWRGTLPSTPMRPDTCNKMRWSAAAAAAAVAM